MISQASNEDVIAEVIKDDPDWAVCPDMLVAPPDAGELRELYPDVSEGLASHCLEPVRAGASKVAVARGAFYCMMRMTGVSPRLAEMLAMQQGPGLDTDDTFFQGQKPLYDQFGSQKHLDRHLKTASQHGFTPSVNATYFPNLARFQGDPEAYVTRSQGRSYIRKLLEKRGWACEGGINVKGREPESDPLAPENCKPLGEDIIRSREAKMFQQDPSLKRVNRKELRERIIEKHGPSK